MLKERSLMIAMDEETLKKHVDALSTDGTVANHFKTKLGLQLSLAPSNKLLDSISEEEAVKETVAPGPPWCSHRCAVCVLRTQHEISVMLRLIGDDSLHIINSKRMRALPATCRPGLI